MDPLPVPENRLIVKELSSMRTRKWPISSTGGTALPSHESPMCDIHITTLLWWPGIQRTTDGSFMHPTYTQRAADGPSHLRPCYVCSHVTSQRATTCNPTERLAGPLIHSKSCPSDSHYLPNLAFQQSSPPASQRCALPAPNQLTGRPSHSFSH